MNYFEKGTKVYLRKQKLNGIITSVRRPSGVPGEPGQVHYSVHAQNGEDFIGLPAEDLAFMIDEDEFGAIALEAERRTPVPPVARAEAEPTVRAGKSSKAKRGPGRPKKSQV